MKIKALVISSEDTNLEILNLILNDEKYKVINVLKDNFDYDILKSVKAIFVDSNIDQKVIREVELFCLENDIKLYIYPSSINLRKPKIKTIDDVLFFCLNPYKISKFQDFIKRCFDIIFSLIFIILSMPLFLLISLLIKTFDGGPVFYYQKRLTKNQKEFVIIKFRTMKVGAESQSGIALSCENDPRLTKIGKILRKYRLDEIPQIFNVLIGDMSVVGPRPERKYFINKYLKEDEYYKYRFNVKAGITGLAQIYGKYDSSFKTKLDYDLYYISNYSLLLDLKIMIKTIIYLLACKKSKIYKKRNDEK